MEIDPGNEAANLNLGLLLAEQGKTDEAEKALRTVLDVNPKQAVAAYNLSVIVSQQNLDEAVSFAGIAAENRPGEPRYAYTCLLYTSKQEHCTPAFLWDTPPFLKKSCVPKSATG